MPADLNAGREPGPGLLNSDGARVATRWPSAEEFYRERDDRTMRVVGDMASHAVRPVEIHVDPASATDVTVQRVALVAANLTARWARRVRVVVAADAALAPPLRRDGATTLVERLMLEMRGADPFGAFAVGTAGEPDEAPLRLCVGPWAAAGDHLGTDDYQVHAVAWTALGRRGAAHGGGDDLTGRAGTAAAAGLAGALGAADLFKRAVGHSSDRWMPTFGWDTWSSALTKGPGAWSRIEPRPVPESLNLGNMLLAGVGAIGSAFVYLADLMPLRGALTLFDRDAIEITNLNRSPLFTVRHALDEPKKTLAAAAYLHGRGAQVSTQTGLWRDAVGGFTQHPFDVWISLTNEDGAWAELPFKFPPVVLHGTTTSGWGFGAGRHIPGREDCTLCRMPRPEAVFRGPCAEGEIAPAAAERGPIRASLPFLSTAAAALVLAGYMQLLDGPAAVGLSNDVSVDLGVGLPAVVALHRGRTPRCQGCRVLASASWRRWGGRGKFGAYSPFNP
jgi:hypothetical protein